MADENAPSQRNVLGRSNIFTPDLFGPGITVGAAFAPFGWGRPYFGWREHSIIINNRPWVRTFANRREYVHPYEWRRPESPRYEHHDRHDDRRDRHDHR